MPRFKPGDKVILGEHQANLASGISKNWADAMDQYVGKIATLVRISAITDSSNSPRWKVDIDGGAWSWREINMQPYQPSIADGVGTPVNDHVCPVCKNNRCSKTEKTCWRCGSKLHP